MPLPEQDVHYFIEAPLAYLNKVTRNEIVLRDPTIEFQSLVFSAYTGLIHLKGIVEGFVYVTASQPFLQHQFAYRRGRNTDDDYRAVMSEMTTTVAHSLQKRFGDNLQIAEPRIFSTVPDDPIEMPPAVFVQPLLWRKEHAYLVLGLSSSEPT